MLLKLWKSKEIVVSVDLKTGSKRGRMKGGWTSGVGEMGGGRRMIHQSGRSAVSHNSAPLILTYISCHQELGWAGLELLNCQRLDLMPST